MLVSRPSACFVRPAMPQLRYVPGFGIYVASFVLIWLAQRIVGAMVCLHFTSSIKDTNGHKNYLQ